MAINELNAFLKSFNKRKIKTYKKGEEFYLSELNIILEGKVEAFFMLEAEHIVQLGFLDETRPLIGITATLKQQYGLDLNYDVFFRVTRELKVLEFPKEDLKGLFYNPSFVLELLKIVFNRMAEVSSEYIIRSSASNEQLVKHLIIKESGENKNIKIDNIFDFANKHNLSRSTLYSSFQKLEHKGEIRKNGKEITIL